jgi:phosphoenolpyruvate phosphomutase
MVARNGRLTPTTRVGALRHALEQKGFVRLLEAHNGLSAIVVENARAERDGGPIEFDGIWESSLTDSGSKGLPDASIVGVDSRAHTIDEIVNVTTKPVVVDGDTGGDAVQFEYLVRRLERLGVSGVVIEDKRYPKRNSLDRQASTSLEDPRVFAQKLHAGRAALGSSDFVIVARVESLIAGLGLDDALMRTERYVLSGADGIMIHYSGPQAGQILTFAEAYKTLCKRLGRRPYLVCVPTTYNAVHEAELIAAGFNVVIHANHLLRSAYKAMQEAARAILAGGRSLEADALCAPVEEIFAAVGYDRVSQKDRELAAALLLEDADWPEPPANGTRKLRTRRAARNGR